MNSELWEGIGGPVRMDRANLGDIDPTLDACCRHEVRVLASACISSPRDSLTRVLRSNPIASDRL